MGRIAVVDYGVGNLKSVTNALELLGFPSLITGDAGEIERADAVILPGVGAFPDAADKLHAAGLGQVLIEQAEKKPMLGICLGMQLLFEQGEEVRPCRGLGLVGGRVRRIETPYKLPHIGWNSLKFQHDSPIFKGLDDGAYVYFVHSFCACAQWEEDVTACTEYGSRIVAAVGRGNVFGCQFHPEKSGETGLAILKNFGELSK